MMKKILLLFLIALISNIAYGDVKAADRVATVTIPETYNTRARQIDYLHNLEEKLRDVHNTVGTWYRDGISEATYNTLPTLVTGRYAYTAQLSEADWNDFLTIVFYPIMEQLHDDRNTLKQAARDDGAIDSDIDRDVAL
jgi:hypothetical protein